MIQLGESKRIYSNNNLDSEKFKKIKLSEDEETQFDNKGEFNYIREHYITNTTNDGE
ncbi:11730_t:CDS:2 [Rhizophagus irregularis]|nr:11730_t:CDS:2 [Rhizophagus irregularis]